MMNEEIIEKIVEFLCNDLGGDWFLTGGSLVRLEFDNTRGTEDLDFVQISHQDRSDVSAKNELYKWLLDCGLGPEWINDAVEPFVRRVPGWEEELVVIRAGKKGRVLRPNLTLFVLLKLNRASEIDLKDIAVVAPKCPERFDERKFLAWADERITAKFQKIKGVLSQ